MAFETPRGHYGRKLTSIEDVYLSCELLERSSHMVINPPSHYADLEQVVPLSKLEIAQRTAVYDRRRVLAQGFVKVRGTKT